MDFHLKSVSQIILKSSIKRIRPLPWEESTGDREDFWELPCVFVASKGLEIPWVQGLLPVVPLGLLPEGGHIVRKIRE